VGSACPSGNSLTNANEAKPDTSNSLIGSGLISGQRKLAICSFCNLEME